MTPVQLVSSAEASLAPGAAALRPTESATGSEEGSAAGLVAFTEGASSTSFCLGGMVISAGVRGEGSVPGAVSADGWGAQRAGCPEATSVAAGAAGGCVFVSLGAPGPA